MKRITNAILRRRFGATAIPVPSIHCEPKKHTKMFLQCVYILQNPTDCDKIGYILSWVNLS